MAWWKRMLGMSADAGGRNPADDRWWGGAALHYGTAVTAETVIQIPEVYDCLNVLSQSVAQLPFIVYRAEGEERRRQAGHPVARLLGEQANISQETTAYELRAQMTWDAALHANAYAELRSRGNGTGYELIRHDPQGVKILLNANTGAYIYEVLDGARTRRVLPEEMVHLRKTPLATGNLMGRSLLIDGHRVFSRALVMEDYVRRFFENDATPGGVVEYEAGFKTQEDADTMRERWQKAFAGKNRGKVAILDKGAKFKPVPVENDKAQFIESYKEAALQVCRLWRMPPHKVGLLDKATFSNIEQQSLEFVIDTLMPWLVMWEQAIKRDLLIEEPNLYAHHNVAGLLRGDLKSRYDSYAVARNWGWLSVNDIRRLENMNPVDDGDIYLQPLNMVPAGTDVAQLQQQRQPQQQPSGALVMALEGLLARRLLPAPGE